MHQTGKSIDDLDGARGIVFTLLLGAAIIAAATLFLVNTDEHPLWAIAALVTCAGSTYGMHRIIKNGLPR